MKYLTFPLALAGMSLLASSASAGTVVRYYVDINSPTSGSGFSWATSFQHLQDALDEAQTTLLGGCGCDVEIFVAAGTYRPDQDMFNPLGSDDRFASFVLMDEVTIYGHFAGHESSLSERDLQNPVHETILSGEIGGAGSTDNSYHVVDGSFAGDVPTTAILDGFTISGGNANGTFSREVGGGLYAEFGRCNVYNTVFEDNNAISGGAVGTEGGANVLFFNCEVRDNTAFVGGGAFQSAATQTWIQSTFHHNEAGSGGGILMDNNAGNTIMTLRNVTMAENTANTEPGDDIRTIGGGTFNYMNIANSIFWSEEPWNFDDATTVDADFVDLRGDLGAVLTSGSVLLNTSDFIDADPVFADAANGDLRLAMSSPCTGAGSNTFVYPDYPDLDGDGDTAELSPLDLNGNERFVSTVDLGAFEALCEVSNYCDSFLNSTGAAAKISAFGSCSLSAQNLTLQATGVPNGPGIFFFGTNQIQAVFGHGLRCVGGVTKRLPPVFGSNNVSTYTMDWNHPNAPFLLPNSTWNFQLWYRDVPAGGAQFNLSDALTITFEN